MVSFSKKQILFGIAVFMMGLSHHASGQSFKQCEGSVAWQILDAENNRRSSDPIFLSTLDSKGKSSATTDGCRVLALRAFGRIAGEINPNHVTWLQSSLNHPSFQVRQEAATALGFLKFTQSAVLLKQALKLETSSAVRAALYRALARSGGASELKDLDELSSDQESDSAIAGLMHGLGILFLKDSASWTMPVNLLDRIMFHAGSDHAEVSRYAAFALARYKGTWSDAQKIKLIHLSRWIKDEETVGYLLRAMAKQKTLEMTSFVCDVLGRFPKSDYVHIDALRVLGTMPVQSCTLKILSSSLKSQSTQVLVQALTAASSLASSLEPRQREQILGLLKNQNSSLWIQEEAARALSVVDKEMALTQGRALIEGNTEIGRNLALVMLTGAKFEVLDRDLLLKAVDLDVRFTHKNKINSLQLVQSLPDEILADLFVANDSKLKENLIRLLNDQDVAIVSTICELIASKGLTEFESTLVKLFSDWTKPDGLEAKQSIIAALEKVATDASKDFLRSLIVDSNVDRSIALAAAQAFKAKFGEDLTGQVSNQAPLNVKTPAIAQILDALKARFKITTSLGTFEMKLSGNAPLTGANFSNLVTKNFYQNIVIHRVVPHFVMQAGDPRGDGYGGPGYMIRDEVSDFGHVRGSMGIATAGKDTGGSQFFVNHGGNYHLDGFYTQFATVMNGIDVVDKLEIYDKILSIVKVD